MEYKYTTLNGKVVRETLDDAVVDYFHDEETEFYYLNSRYYDLEISRFISVDGYIATGQGNLGYNMFAYCGNNPVNRIDPDGNSWKDVKRGFV